LTSLLLQILLSMILMSSINWFVFISIFYGSQTIDKVAFEKCKNEISFYYNNHHAEDVLGYKTGVLVINEQGFLRYTLKTASGKTEYYSLRLQKLKNISFLGTENAIWLVLSCDDESIIYQTYKDRNGDLDEMITSLKIPLKNINIESVNQLNDNFHELKALFYKNTNY